MPATAIVALAALAAFGPAMTVKAVCAAEARIAAGEANPVRLVAAVVAAAARKIAALDQTGVAHAMLPSESPMPDPQCEIVIAPVRDIVMPGAPLAERLLDLPPPIC